MSIGSSASSMVWTTGMPACSQAGGATRGSGRRRRRSSPRDAGRGASRSPLLPPRRDSGSSSTTTWRPAGRKDVVEGAQIVGEDAVGERGDDDADRPGARRGERARELVRNVGEIAHRALDARREASGETMSGLRSAREAVTALTPARAATSESVVRRRLPSLFPRAVLPTSPVRAVGFFFRRSDRGSRPLVRSACR